MRSYPLPSLLTSALLGILLLGACGETTTPTTEPVATDPQPTDPPPNTGKSSYNLDIPMVKYTWDPAAGDAAVPAEMGGPGFTGEGWETRMEFLAIGQADAPQGGSMSFYMPDWPATLRTTGQNSNTTLNYAISALVYESLLTIHPTTMDYIPVLATHWQISEDKTTYRFRINPRARWSDGQEVTAQDVVASYKLYSNPDILFPSTVVYYSTLEEPKAVSKYIVEVKVKEESWQNFMKIALMTVLPAHQLDGLSGADYLDKFQFSYLVGSGPYVVRPEDIVTGQSVAITRRTDWWAEDVPSWDGMYNIGTLKHVVVQEPGLAFEKLKKGEIDYMIVPKAQWWVEEMPTLDPVKRGLLVMRKFYNDAPVGFSGIAINASQPPLDDIRVRKALQHLYDRKTMIEKLFFNEYEPLTSYWQGGTYANPDNPLLEYDELTAVELLEQAGWTEINSEGYRVKDGQVLAFTLQYGSQLSERGLTVFQESAKKAGVKLDLQLLTAASRWKNMTAKEYQLSDTAWGAIPFPNPRSMWHSELADKPDNNNVTAYRNPQVDALIDAYDAEYDPQRRAELIRQIDGLVYAEQPYILGWYGPAHRIAFWNKYGMPEWGAPRILDNDQLFFVWWVDPEKEKALTAALADTTQSMDPGSRENRFWADWNEAQRLAAPPPAPPTAPPTTTTEEGTPGDASGDAAGGQE